MSDTANTGDAPLLEGDEVSGAAMPEMPAKRRFGGKLHVWAGRGACAIMDQGLLSGSNFFMSICLARWMPAEQYGLFAVSLAILLFFASSYQALALVPMMSTAPQLDEAERNSYLEGLHHLLHRLCTALLLVALAVGLLHVLVPSWHLGTALCVILAVVAALVHWQARDLHYLSLSTQHSAQAGAIYAVILIGGVIVLRSLDMLGLGAAFLLMAAGSVASSIWLHRTMPYKLKRTSTTWDLRKTVNHSWRIGRWEFFSSLASWLPGQAIFPAVAGVLGVAQAGALKALLNFATPLNQVQVALYRLLQPYLSGRLGANADQSQARKSVGIAVLLGLAFGIAYLVVVFVLGPTMMRAFYGEGKFEAFSGLLTWALAPTVLLGIAVGFALGLRALNRFPVVLSMFGAGAVVFSLTVIPLSQKFGLNGTIVATVMGNGVTVLWALVAFYLATKALPKSTAEENSEQKPAEKLETTMNIETLAISENPPKQNVVGIGISKTSYEGVVECCRNWIAARDDSRPARYITVTSVHGIVSSREDPVFQQILNKADIATPDGMPVVWAMRSFGNPEQQRVYGPTLTLKLCEDAAKHGHRIFLYGSTDECLESLQANLTKWFPGLQIAGAYSPPFRPLTPEEDADVVDRIRTSRADLVFVGISTPKQEKWMDAHIESLPGTIMIGVGAAFDFHAGKVKQAPAWMQKNGLEWFFRLTTEPKRLWKRYILETPRFLPLWAMQKLGIRRF